MKLETFGMITLDVFLIVIIVASSLFIWNQFVDWKYKAQFLGTPCQLCVELNPDAEKCWEMKQTLNNETIPLLYDFTK